jgi:hypothetical protein
MDIACITNTCLCKLSAYFLQPSPALRNSEVLHNVMKRELRENEMGVGWCSWCYCLCCSTCLGRGLFFALVYWAMVYEYDF